MELLYSCISKLVVYLTKKQPDIISEQLKHYADPNDYNRIFYHQRNDGMKAIIQTLLTDSGCLLHLCRTDFEDVTEYQLFIRCLSDQTVMENEKRRMRTKQDGTMNSSALQNPSDPDATYRNKAGKQYRGYSADTEETVGKNGSVVTDYEYDKNTHTDSQFLQESLSAMEKSEEEIILIMDGGYDGQDNIALAKEKNVRLVTTALIGKEAPDVLADFEFNEDGTRLLKCAAGHVPISQSYAKSTRQCRVSFDRNHCAGCPYQKQCRPKLGYGQHRGKIECGSTALRQRSREKKSKVQLKHDGRKSFEKRRGLRQAAGNGGNLYHRE